MRTFVSGTALEKAGAGADVLGRLPMLKVDNDGSVEVFGRGQAEVYINGRRVRDPKEVARISSGQVQAVDVAQNPSARYVADVKAVVRIQLKKDKGDGLGFVEKASSAYRCRGSKYCGTGAGQRQKARMWRRR